MRSIFLTSKGTESSKLTFLFPFLDKPNKSSKYNGHFDLCISKSYEVFLITTYCLIQMSWYS